MVFYFYKELVLEDERVKLEPMASKHFNDLTSIISEDPDLLKFSPSSFETKSSIKEYFQTALSQRIDRIRYPFVIFDKKSKKYIGSTSLGNLRPNNKQIEIGWTWIGKEYQRTGINRHCKFLLLKYAFEILKCYRVEFRTNERNLTSQNAIRAIGGKYEGEVKKIITEPDVHQRRTIYYSILKEEWPELKERVFSNHTENISILSSC